MTRRALLPVRTLMVAVLISGFAWQPLPVVSAQEPEALALGPVNVLTRNYNNQRTGANLLETTLNVNNVNAGGFGKLFQLPVDDEVYATILYASGVVVGGVTRNVIYVATVNNTLSAFDADTAGPPLWQRNFNGTGRPTRNNEVGQACGTYLDFSGNIGIVGTPVIDGGSLTIYLVSRTVDSDGVTRQRLRALDIQTGADRSPGSVVLSGTGYNAALNNQRPGLVLSQGIVYVSQASFCDNGNYRGMVLAYNATTLAQTAIFNVAPSLGRGGIWMHGAAPSVDSSGSLFLSTGNGAWDGTSNFGESVLKLAGGSLSRQSFFTPANWADLNTLDLDLGASGVVLLPGTNFAVTGGKGAGTGFLLNTANLGGNAPGDTQIPQKWQAVDPTVRPTANHHIRNSMVTWHSPQGLNVYVWGENDFARAYRFNQQTQRLNTPAFAVGSVLPPIGQPGGMMSISADGSGTNSGILWATTQRAGDANQALVPGAFHAFDAEDLSLLWSSATNPGDDTYNLSKGTAPMVANGKVYVASTSNVVSVYGLRATPPPSQNFALNRPATGSAACNVNEGPAKAFNGSYSGGNFDKWCSTAAGTKTLTVDLGSNRTVSQIIVEHAGAGGETFDLNTRAYNLQVSTDNVNFSQVASTSTNIKSITTHNITPVSARWIRLNITTPTQTTDGAARIYELQVFGGGSAPPTAVTYEAESLSVNATSGDLHRVALDAGYSGGQGTILEGNAVGDFVTYNVNVPQARTYNVRIRIKRLSNRGIFQLAVNGVNHGPTVDGYSGPAAFPEIDLGNLNFTTAGNKTFRFQITGRNPSSTSFWIALDWIRLTPQ
jgi:hypothetical protein